MADNLPAPQRMTPYFGARDAGQPEPGSWWRIVVPDTTDWAGLEAKVEKAAALAGRLLAVDWSDGLALPGHGLILLLRKTNIIDGDLHSLVLAPHPGWNGRFGDTTILFDEFEMMAIHEPDGAALRASEEAALMGHVGILTTQMAEPPAEAAVLALAEEKRAKAQRKETEDRRRALPSPAPGTAPQIDADGDEAEVDRMSRMVPAALLPSRDIAQAEAVVKHQIAIAEARAAIMSERVKRVTEGMGVVARFQEEKVMTAMSTISQQMGFAEKMLASVHTMKLWLGEGVGLRGITEGAGAAPDEKIRFMQQLLFLDEEIFTASMFGEGFSGDQLHKLPELLQQNPDVVKRLLPYDRCVAITRVRRHKREFPVPGNWHEVFDLIERQEQDKRVQIFVRDGENLTMIMADDETSGAQRLFPSRAEIDRLFTSNNWGDRGKVIDVSDVRYAEKRKQHDDVALFYKRFLLILWGAHERAQIFGNLPLGMNWLTGETHHAHFDFVHDEELGLGDGRQHVRVWIKDHAMRIRQGSRVVMTWAGLLTEERARGAWNNPVHHQSEQLREEKRRFEIVTLLRKDDKLIAPCLTVKRHEWRDNAKSSNVMVTVQNRVGDAATIETDGLLAIDHMTVADLEAYLESRKAREHYIEFLGELRAALPMIRDREACEIMLINRIIAGREAVPGLRDALKAVAHEAVLASDWKLPAPAGDVRLLRQAQIMLSPPALAAGDLRISVRPGGTILRYRAAPELFDGAIAEPFWLQESLEVKKDGTLALKSSKIVLADTPDVPGDVVLFEAGDAGTDARPMARFHLEDRAWFESILSPAHKEHAAAVLDQVLNPTSDVVDGWVDQLLDYNRGGDRVKRPMAHIVCGLAVLQPELSDGWHRKDKPRIRAIVLEIDQLAHAWLAGRKEEALRFSRIYAEPARFTVAMERAIGLDTLTVKLAGRDPGVSFSKTADACTWENASRGAGFRDVIGRSWNGREKKDVLLSRFEDMVPNVESAVWRGLIESNGSGLAGMSDERRAASIANLKGTRVFMDPEIETRLLKVIGMFEPLPEQPKNGLEHG
ncbi:hypothetical protein ACEUZ9_001059 [Paracoccus litorisediminis]|uniref:hypothetical protein n=1 Tax=Paracoccus litorisediminis TaxID=2006130 RepID=UPI00372DB551